MKKQNNLVRNLNNVLANSVSRQNDENIPADPSVLRNFTLWLCEFIEWNYWKSL